MASHAFASIREALSSGWITVHFTLQTKGTSCACGPMSNNLEQHNAVAVSHLAVPHHVMPTRNDIAFIRSLRDRSSRHTERKFVVEGQKCVAEALSSGWTLHGVYATEGSETPVSWNADPVSSKDMARMSAFKTAPGVLAVVGMPESEVPSAAEWAEDDQGAPFGLAVERLSDPGNLGTLIRTADWFGLRGIWVCPHTVDPFNPKVIQASMGALFRVSVWTREIPELVGTLQSAGVDTHGLDMEGTGIWDVEGMPTQSNKWCGILGSESHGLSEAARTACSGRLHIPGSGGSESLNAAMAAGMVLADWSRRAGEN